MSAGDDETLKAYIDESLEHLAGIETDLLEMEKAGINIDVERVNKVFRAAHSIKGGPVSSVWKTSKHSRTTWKVFSG